MDIKKLRGQVDKILGEPVSCMDGASHYIDESNRRYLASLLLSLDGLYTEVEGELDMWNMQWEGDLGLGARLLNADEIKGYELCQQDMLNAGCKFVKPTKELLKELLK